MKYQERVRHEQIDLYSKIESLRTFIAENPVFATVSDAERDRLNRQLAAMITYNDILNDRIANF